MAVIMSITLLPLAAIYSNMMHDLGIVYDGLPGYDVCLVDTQGVPIYGDVVTVEGSLIGRNLGLGEAQLYLFHVCRV